MLRFVALVVGAGILAVLVCIPSGHVGADEGKTPSIETVMKKLHGKTGSHKVLGKSLDAAEPDWEVIAQHAKLYAELTSSLDKNTPDKGSKKEWDKLAKGYATDAKSLSEAAVKKDKNAAKTVFSKLKDACDNCHENHR